MESEFLLQLMKTSTETIIISIIVFALTMVIKYPIKRATASMKENKRKAINTIIVFIPLALSLLLSTLYYGIFQSKWLDMVVWDTTASAYLLALGIYAIYSRIVVIIKGIKGSKEEGSTAEDTEHDKDALKFIKSSIKGLTQSLKVDSNNLEKIMSSIEELLSIRDRVMNNTETQDIQTVELIDRELKDLESKKSELEEKIAREQSNIQIYTEKIK